MQRPPDEAPPWDRRREPPPFLPGEVHVWRFRLTPPDDDDYGLLSPDERQRALRFAYPEHAQRFVKRRAVLRRLLTAYVDSGDPRGLGFEYGVMGKPELTQPHERLQFNASSSGELGLIAIGLDYPVGVDVELMRDLPSMESVAETSFSAAELAAFLSTQLQDRQAAFYAGWTRKEAFIKAIGQGLAFPLRDFDVSLTTAAAILRIEGARPPPSDWTLLALRPGRGYAGAVAIAHSGMAVHSFSIAP